MWRGKADKLLIMREELGWVGNSGLGCPRDVVDRRGRARELVLDGG